MVFVVTGPSGAGKTTLISRALGGVPGLRFSVSHTTRSPRPSEIDGRDYHFIAPQRFERMRRDGRFAEWAEVHGHFYGTSRKELAAGSGKNDVLLDIDVQGARQIRQAVPEAVLVFILPPSRAELARRLRRRGQDDEAAVVRRLRKAGHEIAAFAEFDYLIVNDEIERAARELESVVLAARCRLAAREDAARRILRGFSAKTGGSRTASPRGRKS
jgi:guanylate kinase